jgi:hypothetical protein
MEKDAAIPLPSRTIITRRNKIATSTTNTRRVRRYAQSWAENAANEPNQNTQRRERGGENITQKGRPQAKSQPQKNRTKIAAKGRHSPPPRICTRKRRQSIARNPRKSHPTEAPGSRSTRTSPRRAIGGAGASDGRQSRVFDPGGD